MQSRMEKYYNSNEVTDNTIELPSRAFKNKELYKEVSNKELETFDVNSNSTILNNNVNNSVDIDQIKEMLDRQYRELPKNKSIGDSETEIGKISLDETREYDINSILEASHKEREKNYEEERLKKLRNTQVDILKELDSAIKEEEDDDILPSADELDEMESHRAKEEKKLRELIDTITAKELISSETSKELDPLDLLSDLRGDDENTKLLGTIDEDSIPISTEEIEKLKSENTKEANLEELETTTKVEYNLEDTTKTGLKLEETLEEKVIAEDYDSTDTKEALTQTNTLTFTQSDFDDFNDLKEDMRFTKVLIKILITIIIIVFIIGCIVLANKIFNLGFF